MTGSPTDALIYLEVRCRLYCHLPIGPDLTALPRLRIAFIPLRRPACRGNVGWLGGLPDVIENVSGLTGMLPYFICGGKSVQDPCANEVHIFNA
jgi:hypothetical protein